jgi:hypothetical protein
MGNLLFRERTNPLMVFCEMDSKGQNTNRNSSFFTRYLD